MWGAETQLAGAASRPCGLILGPFPTPRLADSSWLPGADCWLMTCVAWHPVIIWWPCLCLFLLMFRPQSEGWGWGQLLPGSNQLWPERVRAPQSQMKLLVGVGSWGLLGPLSFRSYFPPDCILLQLNILILSKDFLKVLTKYLYLKWLNTYFI